MGKVCKLEYCDKAVKGAGYCTGHYAQKRFGRKITKLRKSERHGLSYSDEYTIWVGIKNRTTKSSHQDYHKYGAKGIKMCDRWLASFLNFYKDMGERPSKKHSIDRIDPNGDYTPDNCRWATYDIQSFNKKPHCLNTSGHRGVVWNKSASKWRAQIYHNGRNIGLGLYSDISDAIKARETKELEIIESKGV